MALVLVCFIVVFLSFFEIKKSLILILFLLPLLDFYSITIVGLPLLTFLLLGVAPVVILQLLLGDVRKNIYRFGNSTVLAICFILAWKLYSTITSEHVFTQVIQFYLSSDFFPLLMILVFAAVRWTQKDVKIMLWFTFVSIIIVSIIGIIEHITVTPIFFSFSNTSILEFPHRPNGTLLVTGSFNAILSMVLLLALTLLYFVKSKLQRFVIIAGIATILLASYFGNFRGTILPMLMLMAISVFRWRAYRLLMILVLLAASVLVAINFNKITQSEIYNRRLTERGSSRVATYLHSFKVVLESPIIGHGLRNSVDAMAAIEPTYYKGSRSRTTAHNIFLTVLIEEGVIGLSLLVYFYLLIARRIFEFYKKETDPFLKEFAFASMLFVIQYVLLNLTATVYTPVINGFLYSIIGIAFSFTLFQSENEPLNA